MSLPGKYQGAAEVQVDGSTLAESQNVSISLSSNANRVMTMAKGFAGNADGAVINEISVESAVPIAGLEFDAYNKCQQNRSVDLVVVFSGRRYSYRMFIETCEVSAAHDKAGMLSFKGVSGPATLL